MGSESKKSLIVGLGHTGCAVIEALSSFAGYDDVDCLAMDTDGAELEALAQKGIRTMRVCQEDAKSYRPSSHEVGKLLQGMKAEIEEVLKPYEVVICVAGLGGQTGSCVGRILEMVDSLKIPALLLAVMPFSFEEEERIQMAENALMQMEICCQVVLLSANDTALSPDEQESGQGAARLFENHTRHLAQAAAALSVPFARRNLFNVDASLFGGLSAGSTPRCQFLTVDSTSETAPGASIVSSVKNSWLFKQFTFDRAVALLRINGSCRETELSALFSGLKRQFKEIGIEMAACVDEALPVEMRLTLLLHPIENMEEDEAEEPVESPNGQLSIEFPDEGLGIFANDPVNMWNGQNVDVPVFMRKGVQIDKGM